MKNVKAFTLVEILLVVFLLAILGTIAVTSYINSTGTFNYLAQYKNTISAIRTARSFALTNKATNGQSVKYYGVYIDTKKVLAFADLGDTILKYDPKANDADTKYDIPLWEKEFDFSSQDFSLKTLDMKGATITMPIALFYESGTGNLEIRQKASTNNEVIPKTEKCISLEASAKEGTVKKYIVIFQISGLAEEYDAQTVCNTNA